MKENSESENYKFPLFMPVSKVADNSRFEKQIKSLQKNTNIDTFRSWITAVETQTRSIYATIYTHFICQKVSVT